MSCSNSPINKPKRKRKSRYKRKTLAIGSNIHPYTTGDPIRVCVRCQDPKSIEEFRISKDARLGGIMDFRPVSMCILCEEAVRRRRRDLKHAFLPRPAPAPPAAPKRDAILKAMADGHQTVEAVMAASGQKRGYIHEVCRSLGLKIEWGKTGRKPTPTPEVNRQVVVLRRQWHSPKEIAIILGLTRGQVAGILHRHRRRATANREAPSSKARCAS
jgi:hypothetical protein